MQKIRKGDTVKVISGQYRGKAGKVLAVDPKAMTVTVEKINVKKRHTKPSGENKPGGILEKTMPMPWSKVSLFAPKSGKTTRAGFKWDGTKMLRISKASGEEI